jgi:membrane protein
VVDVLKNFVERAKDWFTVSLWQVEEERLGRLRRFFLRQMQLLVLVYREFLADRCMLQASALTYFTLLAIVPLFALTFALLKGFGAQQALEPIILERFTVGSEEMVSTIIGYIDRTNFGSLGVIGLITFLATVVALLTNVEQTFNLIWGVGEARSPFRRFADYFSVLTFAPLLLFAAISMTTTLESQTFVQTLLEMALVGEVIYFLFRLLPYVAMWAAFVFLYTFMPNVKVRLGAALVGGILGGTIWQLAQWGYVTFQVGVSRYNAIYGGMAALPILMVWIYVSWLIVLLGAEVAYAWQNQTIIRREIREQKINFLNQEMVALSIMMVVARTFLAGEKPWGLQRISDTLCLPPRLARQTIDELLELGLLSEVHLAKEEDFAYQPASPPQQMPVHAILKALREDGVGLNRLEDIPEWRMVQELEARFDEAGREALAGMTLQQMVEGLRPQAVTGGQ